jgi:hypothetical protein
MPLILAIEPDRRQASKIATLARTPLHAELVAAETTGQAVASLGERVPDLILTSLLLSPKDAAALADWLRELDAAGTHVQTLVIPVLGTAPRRARTKTGLLTRLRGSRGKDAATEGCDPAVFATQIAEYLERAAEERRATATALEDEIDDIAAAGIASEVATDEVWETVVIEEEAEPGLELTSEPIDLEAFAAELAALEGSACGHTDDVVADFVAALEVIETSEVVDVELEDEPDPPGIHSEADSDLWMPLSLASFWPALEGGVAPPVARSAPVAAAEPAPAAPATAASSTGDRPRRTKKSKTLPPPQDEWGFFDPAQCGFAALLAKLEEISEGDPLEKPQR